MAWSTSELAERAGTTVNAIRHYHRFGLLDEPERELNGYKRYEVHHLVSLLRIRRLTDLGFSLTQIREARGGVVNTSQSLHDLDAELEEKILRLERARADIAEILRDDIPTDTPAGFGSVAPRLSDSDASLVHVYTQLYDESALADIQAMAEDTEDVGADLNRLRADADEETRSALVDRLADSLEQSFIAYPWLNDPAAHLSKSAYVTSQTMVEVIHDLYNPAQLDVLERAHAIAVDRMQSNGTT